MQEQAYRWIERQIRKTRIAIGHAECKQSVNSSEVRNLYQRLNMLEWLSQLVLNAKEESL